MLLLIWHLRHNWQDTDSIALESLQIGLRGTAERGTAELNLPIIAHMPQVHLKCIPY